MIEGNLLAHDRHLAQLLKLDDIGADVLSEDKEKQLRSVQGRRDAGGNGIWLLNMAAILKFKDWSVYMGSHFTEIVACDWLRLLHKSPKSMSKVYQFQNAVYLLHKQ